MFEKVLVANRGEIAVRAFRAAVELGASTVAVYPFEDRNSAHRAKAFEAYQIGDPGNPVGAYLSVDAIMAAVRESGADAVYPGYGFLSEKPALATACKDAGITFVGPSVEVLELTGDKSRAIAAAKAAGLPVLASSPPSDEPDVLIDAARAMTFPLFVKAVAGGGGRGMRRVPAPEQLRDAIEAASREAKAAFGDGTVFLEQAVIDPRHIEVQILGDTSGEVIHLFERDCSLQRRHQKVVEVAPAPGLDPELRQQMCADAVAFARHIGYTCAGTVEFLLDPHGNYVFIEMNPRIQVEHTVTEEITDVDLVTSQLRTAFGDTLADLGLSQDDIEIRGSAIQCRITTEDPTDGFRPDTGEITAYRTPGGSGVRLDGSVGVGSEISPHFDSMLVKIICRGADFATACARSRRAVTEFRVRGVATNISFLQAVLEDPDFLEWNVDTTFIEDHPLLLTQNVSADRGSRILRYLADVTVNRPHGERPSPVYPVDKLPPLDAQTAPPAGSRDRLRALGPAGFATDLRSASALAVTDTTFRDAHQSLLATRVRTRDLVAVAPHVARLTPQLLSVEAWGGATYDVALRFLHEDPWERLALLRSAMPNICLQMLLRGRNTVGYTAYPDSVTHAFVAEAAETGIDIFRIFDALNNVDQMRPAIDAVRDTGVAVAEVAMSYTGDLADPGESLYTLDYYLRLAEEIVEAGAHVLAIKDMAGLLRPAAAVTLVTALRSRFDLPVHLHTHDTPGGQLATYYAAWQAGVDAVDGASAALAGTTSQPALSAIVAATEHTDRATGLDLGSICDLEPYWAAVRSAYAPFESGLRAPTGRVYAHEIPGGQLSNLRQQASALGLAERFEDIEEAYAGADRILGRITKVTPSSKVVGDLAMALVGADATAAEFAADPSSYDIPGSVVDFLRGDLGTPAGGWPEPLRSRALKGRGEASPQVSVGAANRAALATPGRVRRETLNRLLFPEPAAEFERHRDSYGDTSQLSTNQYFYGLRQGDEHRVVLEQGVELLIGLEAISEPDSSGSRNVLCVLNGQLRPVRVRDRSIETTERSAEKADRTDPAHLSAPFSGVVTLSVKEGDTVDKGESVGSIEAMKMEATITATTAGVVTRVLIGGAAPVEGGDLLLVVGA
ncbi:MAG: pyruvate carboxylase [Rhodococcus sp. (in: high G+C Gram-positive bacteria)]|uniref:pyruvate carboxylase n=1 Tax=Rhodococcus sp. TaxID=1831 RepID=UPI002AD613C8|nr:pyruvate carboxylase [Rhodococcus sp. (in: high G+C Gram-positive bacteria)]MDZ7932122.1 pyruvate carboxylase [Rhodococcus sp. (in: high G+C Gram-positive bacteria)]